MRVWSIPEVREAATAILHAAALVRLEHPELPLKRRLQEARRQCPEAILAATLAIIRAEELATNGVWQAMPWSRHTAKEVPDESPGVRQRATTARYRHICKIAATNPDWSHRRLAEYFGCSSTTVGTALARTTATIVPPGSTSPAVGQRQPVAPPGPAKTGC